MRTSIYQRYLCLCPCGCRDTFIGMEHERCNPCERPGHRRLLTRLAALEAVAEAARTVQVQTELGYVPASVITQSWGELDAALAALDALTEVNTDG